MNRRERKIHKSFDHITGDGFLTDYVSDDLPPRFKAFMDSNPDLTIRSLTINRKLIESSSKIILNILSLGKFSRNQKKYAYDQVYHISLVIELSDGYKYRLEKNQVIQMWSIVSPTESRHVTGNGIIDNVKNYLGSTLDRLAHTNPSKIVDSMEVPLTTSIKFNDFIQRGIALVGIKHFVSYNSISNNCQAMISQVLKGSNLYPERVQKFVLQSAKKLVEGVEFLQPFLNANTDALAILDRLLH